MLDPSWNVNTTKSKSLRTTLDYILLHLPHDSLIETTDGAPIPCTWAREKDHKKLVLTIIRLLSTTAVEKYVEQFLSRFPSNIEELDMDMEDDEYFSDEFFSE